MLRVRPRARPFISRMHAHDNIMTMSTAMGSLRSVMAAASLSALLWRGAASSSRPSLAALASRGPAFQDGGARRRHRHHHHRPRRPPLLATAFSSGGGGSSSFSSSASSTRLRSAPAEAATEEPRRPIPTILLAGFLGSGKTSTLKHLLENNASVRIGTIVNDVASVNIDAKLIANSDSQKGDGGGDGDGDDGSNVFNGSADGVVELQNGCACCSLADELMTSVVRLTKGGERELDAIVVELSGVADPVAVRENWEKARAVRVRVIDVRRVDRRSLFDTARRADGARFRGVRARTLASGARGERSAVDLRWRDAADASSEERATERQILTQSPSVRASRLHDTG